MAVLGASSRPDSLAGRPLENLQQRGFAGPIYPVNPSRHEVAGITCYPNLNALPEPPEAAVIVLPTPHVLPAIRECAEAGVKAIVVISAGFAEIDGAGAALQQQMSDLANLHGMVILGPNSIGLLNFVDRIPLTFTSSSDMERGYAGRVGLVSHSGGLMSSLANRMFDAGLGLSFGIATGNEADLTAAEVLEFFAEDPHTNAVLLVLESVKDGPRFGAACQALLQAGKPVIAYKIGRTAKGGAATRSHTGALAGSYRAVQAVFRYHGVFEAADLDDLMELAGAAASDRRPQGANLGVLTGSGGAGAAAADFATNLGLQVPDFSDELRTNLREFLPGFASVVPENPFDATAQIIEHPASAGQIVAALMDDAGLDAVIGTDPGTGVAGKLRAEGLIAAAEQRRKPYYQVVLSGSHSNPMRDTLRAAGIPVFSSPGKAVAALAGLRRFEQLRKRAREAPPAGTELLLPKGHTVLDEAEAKRVLANLGLPVIAERTVHTPNEACAAAHELGRPVAIKVLSPEIMHKSEVGGVRLNVSGEQAVRDAYAAVTAACKSGAAAALVSPMIDIRLELIAGLHSDPTFGALVMLGLGGLTAEALDDVSIRPVPLCPDDVREMAGELRGSKLLSGFRNIPPVDMSELEHILMALSRLAALNEVASLDINPLALTAEGHLAIVDAAIELRIATG